MHPFPALGLNMGLGRSRNMANLLLPRFQPDSGASAVLVDELERAHACDRCRRTDSVVCLDLFLYCSFAPPLISTRQICPRRRRRERSRCQRTGPYAADLGRQGGRHPGELHLQFFTIALRCVPGPPRLVMRR